MTLGTRLGPQTVREGKPVARQVRRNKGGAETVAVVIAPTKLRDDQFAATEELTASERALVALYAERLLVDPPAILRVAVTAGLCTLAMTGAITQTRMAETVALAGVNVVDVELGGVRLNQTIVVSTATGRIVEIGAGATTKRIDATGKFVIPGLWDMHRRRA